jgi:hypothetical protein
MITKDIITFHLDPKKAAERLDERELTGFRLDEETPLS